MAVAAPSRVSDADALPLIERRILFHPAKDVTLATGISALPAGVEPINKGFDASPAPAPEDDPAAPSSSPSSKGTKRSWQEANAGLPMLTGDQAPLKIGGGLVNMGNTCFLNSVLQCLTYTQPLANYLLAGHHKATCRHSGFCALCALETHVKDALQSRGKVISPNYIVKNLRSISRAFQPWRQEDAHEYLRYLMEALQKSCLPLKTPSNSPEQEKTPMHQIFGGRLRSEVRCTACLHRSDTLEPFWDLSLDITRADSLGKAMAWFTSNEILDGENKYNCSKCKKKVRAIKRFTIETAPSILTVQFKRFSSTGMHGQKIDKKVTFGRKLDLSPFMSNARDGAVYDLYGVLVHAGHSTHSGHYFCFVRSSGDMWHVLDDSRVKQCSEQNVLEQKAYILFYTRKQTKNRLAPEPSTVPAGKPAGFEEPALGGSSILQVARKLVADMPSEPVTVSELATVQPGPEPGPEKASSDNTPVTKSPARSPQIAPTPDIAPPTQEKAPAEPKDETVCEGEADPAEVKPVENGSRCADMPVEATSSVPAAENSGPESEPVLPAEAPQNGLEQEGSELSKQSKGSGKKPKARKSPSPAPSTAASDDAKSVQKAEEQEEPKRSKSSSKKSRAESPSKSSSPAPGAGALDEGVAPVEAPASGEKDEERTEPAESNTSDQVLKQSKSSGKKSKGGSPRRSSSPTEFPTVSTAVSSASVEASTPTQPEHKEPEPDDNSRCELLKRSKSSVKKLKVESPRKWKTESPKKADKGYLKLLRAMPKSRRLFLARALELDQDVRLEANPLKRKRVLDTPELKPKRATTISEDDSAAAAAATPQQSSEPSKPEVVKQQTNSGSELFGTGVARWGDVDAKDVDRFLRSEHKVSSKRPDEWDEDYDRGKVKKVRRVAVGQRLTPCKNNEGGSNPFQVLAAHRHKK